MISSQVYGANDGLIGPPHSFTNKPNNSTSSHDIGFKNKIEARRGKYERFLLLPIAED